MSQLLTEVKTIATVAAAETPTITTRSDSCLITQCGTKQGTGQWSQYGLQFCQKKCMQKYHKQQVEKSQQDAERDVKLHVLFNNVNGCGGFGSC